MGTWYKFALDVSATSATIFLNDQQLTSLSQTNIPATAMVSVGMFWGDGSYTGNLYVDNVQISTSAPPPIPTWSKTYGSGIGRSVVKTSDGGYAIAGDSYSSVYGVWDVYLVKTDSAGTMQWDKTYGGTGNHYGYSVVQTSDGGYAIAGSNETYVNGIGVKNVYLVKTDDSGNMLWSQTYGGTDNVYGISVVQTLDGGYAIAGYTDSSHGGGITYVYLVKTDSSGTMQWSKTLGGTGSVGTSVVQSSDGGYAIAGYSSSGGGGDEVYLVKTDASGNMQWDKTYGRGLGSSVVKTSDGGYAIAGYVPGSNILLVKTDGSGNKQWEQTYGGAGSEGSSVVQASDGGYAIAGSNGASVILVKTGANGNLG